MCPMPARCLSRRAFFAGTTLIVSGSIVTARALLAGDAPAPTMQTGGGYNLVYMRGVATGGDGQAITSLPSVGTYLDEQPITTIRGNLDVAAAYLGESAVVE